MDNWFLGVACAGSQCPAPGASLPDVHKELTGRGRHLLLPETDLLTPPPSPPSVVQLGVYGGPPGGAVSCDASVSLYCLHPAGQPCLLFRACRYSSGLIRRGFCGLWRCCLHLMLRHYCRFFRLKALRDMHGGGLKELRTAPDLTPRATKVMARTGPYRQHCDRRVHQTTRWSMLPSHVATRPPPPSLESEASEVASRHSHSGLAQPDSRRAATSCAPRRVETPSPDGPADLEMFRTRTARPVRVPRDVSLPVVLLPERRNTRHGHTGTQLAAGPLQVCISPSEPSRTDTVQDQGGRGADPARGAILAHPDLFPELMLLVTVPPWQIPLRKDLLPQRRGTLWYPRPDLWKLHVWSLDGTRRF